MCSVAEIASCQLSFLSIQSENYIEDVNTVLDIIKKSGLEYNIGEMSTIVKGNKSIILNMINTIYELMSDRCNFVIDIRLSNTCGCTKK